MLLHKKLEGSHDQSDYCFTGDGLVFSYSWAFLCFFSAVFVLLLLRHENRQCLESFCIQKQSEYRRPCQAYKALSSPFHQFCVRAFRAHLDLVIFELYIKSVTM